MSDIKNKIEGLLKNSEIQIKPKWHFVLKSVAVMLALIFVFVMLAFIFSFLIFITKSLPPREMMQIIINLKVLPWILAFIVLLIIAFVILFSGSLNFIKKTPTMFVLLSFLISVFAVGIVTDNLKVHDRAFREFKKRDIKIMRQMYMEENMPREMYMEENMPEDRGNNLSPSIQNQKLPEQRINVRQSPMQNQKPPEHRPTNISPTNN